MPPRAEVCERSGLPTPTPTRHRWTAAVPPRPPDRCSAAFRLIAPAMTTEGPAHPGLLIGAGAVLSSPIRRDFIVLVDALVVLARPRPIVVVDVFGRALELIGGNA